MENRLNSLIEILNEIGKTDGVIFTVKTKSILSSNAIETMEISIWFENKTIKNKRIMSYRFEKTGNEDIVMCLNSVAENLLIYLMFSKDFTGDGFDLGRNVLIEVYSARTIFNKN